MELTVIHSKIAALKLDMVRFFYDGCKVLCYFFPKGNVEVGNVMKLYLNC